MGKYSTASLVLAIALVACCEAAVVRRSLPSEFTYTTSRGVQKVKDAFKGHKSANWDKLPDVEDEKDMEAVIIKGEKVGSIRDFPQLVTLIEIPNQFEFYSICTGTLISPNLVLTAAHCMMSLKDGYSYSMCSGTTDIYSDTKHSQCSGIETIYVPSQFDNDLFYHGYDLAVAVLSREIAEKPVKVAKLSFRRPQNRLPAYLAGFGYKRKNQLLPDGKLRFMEATVVLNNGKCGILAETELLGDTQLICAKGYPARTCNGDSGSPLLIQSDKPKNYVVAGVLSFGVRGCFNRNEAVYSSLYDQTHIDFLKAIVKKTLKQKFQTTQLPRREKKEDKEDDTVPEDPGSTSTGVVDPSA